MSATATSPTPAAIPGLPAAIDAGQPVILYDGVCGFCDRAVRWILDHEAGTTLRYAALQGETATAMRRQYPNIPEGIDTVVYIADGRAHLRSKAFLQLARHLRGPWRWAYHLRWMPGFLLDIGYRAFAAVRYRLFGKLDECRLPSPDERARFLP